MKTYEVIWSPVFSHQNQRLHLMSNVVKPGPKVKKEVKFLIKKKKKEKNKEKALNHTAPDY